MEGAGYNNAAEQVLTWLTSAPSPSASTGDLQMDYEDLDSFLTHVLQEPSNTEYAENEVTHERGALAADGTSAKECTEAVPDMAPEFDEIVTSPLHDREGEKALPTMVYFIDEHTEYPEEKGEDGLRTVSITSLVKCKQCNLLTVQLTGEGSVNTPVINGSCAYCGFEFSSHKGTLVPSTRREPKDQGLGKVVRGQSGYCCFKGGTEEDRSNHLRWAHKDIRGRARNCSVCEFKGYDMLEIRKHEEKEHRVKSRCWGPRVSCPLCDSVLMEASLRRHYRWFHKIRLQFSRLVELPAYVFEGEEVPIPYEFISKKLPRELQMEGFFACGKCGLHRPLCVLPERIGCASHCTCGTEMPGRLTMNRLAELCAELRKLSSTVRQSASVNGQRFEICGGGKGICCSHCGYTCSNEKRLQEHVKKRHQGLVVNRVACFICSKAMSHQSTWRHMKRGHGHEIATIARRYAPVVRLL